MPNVLVVLNERWRVVDDPIQWILQVRKGRETARASGWRSRNFCVSRTGLRRSIGELCGEVDPVAVFQSVLDAFAESVGAGDHKIVIVVLDNAGWHVSKKVTGACSGDHREAARRAPGEDAPAARDC